MLVSSSLDSSGFLQLGHFEIPQGSSWGSLKKKEFLDSFGDVFLMPTTTELRRIPAYLTIGEEKTLKKNKSVKW